MMGAEGAVGIVFKHEIETAEDKEAVINRKIQEYTEKFMTPYIAAKLGMIDEVIAPEDTRKKIKAAFESLKNKARNGNSYRHGNIPL